jgi:uncharacterized membrane protein
VLSWAERGAIPAERLPEALQLLGILPTSAAWRRFLDRLSLWLGAAALGAALIFFVAANWAAVGSWAKFGVVEALVVGAVLAYVRLGPDRAAGKAALLGASLALGALLALVGQTYQTGADTFELFASWAALLVPWVLIGRFAGLWVFWLALVNLAVVFHFRELRGIFGVVLSSTQQVWALAALNAVALVVWEIAARRIGWLRERWAPRVLAVALGAIVTGQALWRIVDGGSGSGATALGYGAWTAGMYLAYRMLLPDLFMLAGGCLSVIVVATALVGRPVLEHGGTGGLLVIAVLVVGMAGGAAAWLRAVGGERAA